MAPDERSGAAGVVETLEAAGVEHVFGNPGTTELPLVRAIARSELQYIQTLHEDIAVGMASGYAIGIRHRGSPAGPPPLGVVNLHVAPGVAHGLCNLYNAHRVGAPIIVTAGNHARSFRDAEPLLGGDLVAMTEQFTKWSTEVVEADAVPTTVRTAIERAMTPPMGPVFVSLPLDVQRATTTATIESPGSTVAGTDVDDEALARAVDALLDATSPVLIVGDRVPQGGEESIEAAVRLADAIGARVHGEVLTAEVGFPPTHHLWVSPLPPGEDRLRTLLDTDTLVFAGCTSLVPLTEPELPLLDDDTTVVRIGFGSDTPGIRPAREIVLEGDPGVIMAHLAGQLDGAIDRELLDDRVADVAAIKTFVESVLETLAEPVDPVEGLLSKPAVVEALETAIPDAYLVDEGVTGTYPLRLRFDRRPGGYQFSKGSGLGYGVAAALGAGLAVDDRPVVGYLGDGSYLYYPQALYTAVRHGIDVTFLVLDNRGYRILKDNMVSMFDDVTDADFVGMDIEPAVELSGLANAQAMDASVVSTEDDLRRALERGRDSADPSFVVAEVHD